MHYNVRKLRYFLQRVAPGIIVLLNYQRCWLLKDIVAGLSVAAVALPVGIAYAELAGVSAVIGMYSAIFPLFAYAVFGSSRQLMTGPDAATCIIVAASLGPLSGGDPDLYLSLLFALTIVTGLLYLLAGIVRLGFLASFLSQPILIGYLNGIALLIIVGQLPNLLGYVSTKDFFFWKILEFITSIDHIHWPTMILGLSLLITLLLQMRFFPRLPGALIVVVLSILAVTGLGLEQQGVMVLGAVPGGLPAMEFPSFNFNFFNDIFSSASGIMLVSFTSGVLTAKSFAQRNGYTVDANKELIGFGAANLASALAHGFPVTGADSRTAVNNAMGGKTQIAGVVAGGSMLVILLFLTTPLAYVPKTALAAVILLAAMSLFDFSALRVLYRMSHREFLLSVGTSLGVLVFGVLPGVLIAVCLSLVWLLSVESRPSDAILGKVHDMKGLHSVADYPQAKTIPGLLIYRFDANIVFYNVEFFKIQLLKAIAAQKTQVEWVVIDASPINIVDVSALNKLDELRYELEKENISVYYVKVKRQLENFFNTPFAKDRRKAAKKYRFQTLKPAIRAYLKYKKDKGLTSIELDKMDPDIDSSEWKEPVQSPK